MTRFFQRLDTRARATALFTGLGLAYNLLQSLVMPAEWEYSKLESTQDVGTLWPLLQPAGVLVRVGVTLAAGALVLWGLRPCPRRRGEGCPPGGGGPGGWGAGARPGAAGGWGGWWGWG